MIEALERLNQAGHISPDEAAEAKTAHLAGDPTFTMGFELELLPEGRINTPAIAPRNLSVDGPRYWEEERQRDTIEQLGFKVEADGVYEAVSPVASHPLPLAIATKGIVRAGLIPAETEGLEVTAHINLGSKTEVQYNTPLFVQMIRLLRVLELSGGTTTDRILQSLRPGQGGEGRRWHTRGIAGVSNTTLFGTQWQGDAHRVELRSLEYRNPEQFGQTLDRAYHLGRALLSGGAAKTVYDEFDAWFIRYQKANGITDITKMETKDRKHLLEFPDADFRSLLIRYFMPYLTHMDRADKSGLTDKLRHVIDNLRDIFEAGEPSRAAA